MAKAKPGHPDSANFEQDTWLEPESLCPPSGGFHRRARALMDGKLRIFKAGLCDTSFSIPVKGYDGFLSVNEDGALEFSAHTLTKRAGDEACCPTAYTDVRGQAGCGSDNVSAVDDEGYRFCYNCGIFFPEEMEMMSPKNTAEEVLPELLALLDNLGVEADYRVTGGSKKRPQLDFSDGDYLIYFKNTGNFKFFRPGHEPNQHLLEAAPLGAIAQQIQEILGSQDAPEEALAP